MGGQSHCRAGSLGSQAVCTAYTLGTASSAQVPYQAGGKATATHHPSPGESAGDAGINSGEEESEDGEAGDKGADEVHEHMGRVEEKWARIKCR